MTILEARHAFMKALLGTVPKGRRLTLGEEILRAWLADLVKKEPRTWSKCIMATLRRGKLRFPHLARPWVAEAIVETVESWKELPEGHEWRGRYVYTVCTEGPAGVIVGTPGERRPAPAVPVAPPASGTWRPPTVAAFTMGEDPLVRWRAIARMYREAWRRHVADAVTAHHAAAGETPPTVEERHLRWLAEYQLGHSYGDIAAVHDVSRAHLSQVLRPAAASIGLKLRPRSNPPGGYFPRKRQLVKSAG